MAFRTALPIMRPTVRQFSTKPVPRRTAFWSGLGTASVLLAASPLYADTANAWWGWSKPETTSEKLGSLGDQLKREVDRAIEVVSHKAGDLLESAEETKRREQARAGKWLEDDGSPQDLTQLLTVRTRLCC